MTLKQLIWENALDPIIRRMQSRLEHFQSLRSTTHNGSLWLERAVIGTGSVFYPDASLTNGSTKEMLDIGPYSHVRGEITVHAGGRFSIGSHSFIGSGCRFWSRTNIAIGNHVLISHLVDIHDTDSHSLDWKMRRQEGIDLFERLDDSLSPTVASAPIAIGDDVWIGFKSTILKGVTIGRGAVVAAGSVVTKDVPPFTLVAGNPARIVRELPQ